MNVRGHPPRAKFHSVRADARTFLLPVDAAIRSVATFFSSPMALLVPCSRVAAPSTGFPCTYKFIRDHQRTASCLRLEGKKLRISSGTPEGAASLLGLVVDRSNSAELLAHFHHGHPRAAVNQQFFPAPAREQPEGALRARHKIESTLHALIRQGRCHDYAFLTL